MLTDKIVSQTEDKSFYLIQDLNSTFTVRYDSTCEETAPVEQKFFITRHPVTLDTAVTFTNSDEKFNYEDISHHSSL